MVKQEDSLMVKQENSLMVKQEHILRVKQGNCSSKVKQEEDSSEVRQEKDSSKVKQGFIQKSKVIEMDKKQCTNMCFRKEEFNVFKVDQVNIPKVHEDIINKDVSNILKDESLKGDSTEINQKVISEVNLAVNQNICKTVKVRPSAHFQRPKIPKPFPCSLCDFAFNRRLFLTKHMQLHH
jgi:hypothetical protein